MSFRWALAVLLAGIEISVLQARCQSASSTQSSSSKRPVKPVRATEAALAAGSVSDGVYTNKSLGLTCKVPIGWVLRTDEMNAQDDGAEEKSSPQRAQGSTEGKGGRVLLAAFSRPPDARGEEVNASIVIAGESATAYPGLKEAAQYFGPLTEVTKAQGFEVVQDPYEFTAGARTLVRGDFQKDVGNRVMRQSTLVMLAKGYAVSITFIGGTEDEVERLVEGLSVGVVAPRPRQ